MEILIVNNSLEIGGIETSLCHLLQTLIGKGHSVDLFLFHNSKSNKVCIPNGVRVIYAKGWLETFDISFRQCFKIQGFSNKAYAILSKVLSQVFTNEYVISLALKHEKTLGPYDLAFSYRQEGNLRRMSSGYNRYVLSCVETKRRAAWIHGDFESLGYHHEHYRRIYSQMDSIVFVSKSCLEKFEKVLPNVNVRKYCVYNMHDYSAIIDASTIDPYTYQRPQINILCVARLAKEKGIDRAVIAIYKAVETGHQVMLHIVGDGEERQNLTNLVKKKHLEEYVVFHGYQKNPFRFMRGADLLLVPSFHEAAPMVYGESMSLGLPVLTTNTTSAKELVEAYHGGWICDNNQESISSTLCSILDAHKLLKSIKELLCRQQFDNQEAIKQLNSFLHNDDC